MALVNPPGRTGPRVLIIVPTHDHASTLDIAVASALSQTIANLDIAIVGDGVGDDTREVAYELVKGDDRVRFLDRPKSTSRNEGARHELIRDTDADIVTYLGDDDLFFPNHVETMVGLLHSQDFAHPFPVIIDKDGRLKAYPTDLGDDLCVQWHLQHGFNAIGLTGAAHTVALYRSLPDGWTEPPTGWWSDQFFWTQIFRQPNVRLATSLRCTVIKHPASQSDVTPDERRRTLLSWSDRIRTPGFEQRFETMVGEAIRVRAVDEYRSRTLRERAMENLAAQCEAEVERSSSLSLQLGDLVDELGRMNVELAAARTRTAAILLEIETIRATRTWRLRTRLLASPIGSLLRAVFVREGASPSVG